MRLVVSLAAATAYALGRPAKAAAIAPETPVLIAPWRPAAMTDEPDPIAQFIAVALKPSVGSFTSASLVLDAYETWADRCGFRAAERKAALDRIARYVTVADRPGYGPCVIGRELRSFTIGNTGPGETVQVNRPSTPALRSMPGLRARVLADAALLSAELLATLMTVREVLEPALDAPGAAGDVARAAAAALDDAIADAAAPAP